MRGRAAPRLLAHRCRGRRLPSALGSPTRSRSTAVWPRPQIEASLMHRADLGQQRQLVGARRCRARPRAGARASSWRTVPTRQGTHCPQISWRKKAAMRRSERGRSTVSSSTTTTPEPSVVVGRACALEGERQCRARPGVRKTPAAPPISTACSARPSRHAAGQVEELAQRGAERHLVQPGRLTVARHAEQLRARRRPGAGGGERLAAVEDDRQHVDQRLDVVDERRLAEQADIDGERRFGARLAAEPLDRVEQRRLLAADVGAGAVRISMSKANPTPITSGPR